MAIFMVLFFFMYTHNRRLVTYILEMNVAENAIDTKSIVGEISVIDLIIFVVFSVYLYYAGSLALKAFRLANQQFKKFKTKKNYNLYSLIFADSEFEN